MVGREASERVPPSPAVGDWCFVADMRAAATTAIHREHTWKAKAIFRLCLGGGAKIDWIPESQL